MKTRLMLKVAQIFALPETVKVDYDTIKIPLSALEGITITDLDSHLVRFEEGFIYLIEMGAGG